MHQRHAQILEHFWSRWKSEYLTDDQPRGKWNLAVVEKLIFGNDGKTRAVRIRTDNCITTRPIIKLYLSSGGFRDHFRHRYHTVTRSIWDTNHRWHFIWLQIPINPAVLALNATEKMSEWSRVFWLRPLENVRRHSKLVVWRNTPSILAIFFQGKFNCLHSCVSFTHHTLRELHINAYSHVYCSAHTPVIVFLLHGACCTFASTFVLLLAIICCK